MNQMIIPKAINFNELVKNSNTTLSLTIQTKLVDKLTKEFSHEEQQWYIANLYIYMHYHPTKDYPINLEDVFKMIGFANKGNAMKTIKSNFTEGEDYNTIIFRTEKNKLHEETRGRKEETVMLNIDTFKNLCMLAKTKKGKEIRKYYVKLENIYNELMKEEIEEHKNKLEETKKQLEEQQKKLDLLEHKPKTNGFLSRRKGFVYIIRDRSKPGHYKIGMTYNVDKRLRNLNTSSSEKTLDIYNEIESFDCELLEKIVHALLQPFNISGRREWFFFQNENEIEYAYHVLHKTNNFLKEFDIKNTNDFYNYYKKYIENNEINVKIENEHEKEFNYNEKNCDIDLITNTNTYINNTNNNTNTNTTTESITESTTEPNIYKLTGQQLKNKSGNYKGVFWCGEKQKWRAGIKLHYKEIFLGYFNTEIDGAKVYNDYASYLNQTDKTNYLLNDIPDYITTPRDIVNENKTTLLEQKTSKWIGVSYDSTRKMFTACIKLHRKSNYLGNSSIELDCAKFYNQQALYYNNTINTNYQLNDIPNYTTLPVDIYSNIQKTKIDKKTTQYFGVCVKKNKDTIRYRAYIVYNKKQISLGLYKTEKEAAVKYNEKAIELNLLDNSIKYKLNEVAPATLPRVPKLG